MSVSMPVLLALAWLAATPAPRELDLAGTLDGRLPIHMTLTIGGGNATGRYFYDRFHKDIAVRGRVTADGSIVLDELDAKGIATAQFRGVLKSDRLEGRWYRPSDTRGLPFTLGYASTTWVGKWSRTGSIFEGTTLTISEPKAKTFAFVLDGQSGGHIDTLEGTTAVQGDRASWSNATRDCRLEFVLKTDEVVVDADKCSVGAMGIEWGGHLQREVPVSAQPADHHPSTQVLPAGEGSRLQTLGVVTKAQDVELQRLTGDLYTLFDGSFQLVSEDQDLDGFGAKVRSGGVRGLFTEMGGIVMVTPKGTIWAAAIDSYRHAVYYFTNEPASRHKLPKTIEAWRSPFSDNTVIFPDDPK